MTRRSGADTLPADLASLLARAYLRLAQKSPQSDVFRPGESQKPLDVSRPESPHGERERAPWKQA